MYTDRLYIKKTSGETIKKKGEEENLLLCAWPPGLTRAREENANDTHTHTHNTHTHKAPPALTVRCRSLDRVLLGLFV